MNPKPLLERFRSLRTGVMTSAALLATIATIGNARAQVQAIAQPILKWTLVANGCPPIASSYQPMTCGNYGTFYFGTVNTGSCSVLAANAAEPLKAYSKAMITKTFAPSSPGKLSNWVAVLDTQGEHSRSVNYLISALAGPGVGIESLSIDEIGRAHV